MAIIIEDGTGSNPEANAYVDRAYVITYALARGIVLANTDATDVLIIKAMDYLALYDHEWTGERSYAEQPLAWPRTAGRTQSGKVLNTSTVPDAIKKVVAELCLVINRGIDLFPVVNPSEQFITSEKIGPIETTYSVQMARELLGQLPKLPLVDYMIAEFLRPVSQLKTVRV